MIIKGAVAITVGGLQKVLKEGDGYYLGQSPAASLSQRPRRK
ncbi:hypothetical protein [Mesorhizobium sp. AR10]